MNGQTVFIIFFAACWLITTVKLLEEKKAHKGTTQYKNYWERKYRELFYKHKR